MVEKQYFETLNDLKEFVISHHISFYSIEVPNPTKMGVVLMQKFFICEICGEKTPKDCEGSEPNTCAMCMPLTDCEN